MASANLMEFNAGNWEQEVLQSDKPVVVDFWAPWCGPCRQLTPIVDRLAEQYAGKVKIGKVNIDDNQDIAVRYGIMSIPRIYIFQGGEPKEQMVGLKPETEFVQAINRALGV